MARTPRRVSSSGIYHIMVRGSGKQIIFEDNVDCRFFLKTLVRVAEAEEVDILAWCLMSNHIHLLIHTEVMPGEFMKKLNASYALFFNKRHERIGHLLQDRYKSESVEDESHLMTVTRYIHQNPVVAGYCKQCIEYRWSSYYEYVEEQGICDTSYILGSFGGLKNFKEMHGVLTGPPKNEVRGLENSRLIRIVESEVRINPLGRIKELDKGIRNEALVKMLRLGLSIRQIQRLTGIGYKIIANLSKMVSMGT